MPLPEQWLPAPELLTEFDEREAVPTAAEVAERRRADAAWLAAERAEHEALVLSLEEELAALLETMRTGEPSPATAQPDPPGWPAL